MKDANIITKKIETESMPLRTRSPVEYSSNAAACERLNDWELLDATLMMLSAKYSQHVEHHEVGATREDVSSQRGKEALHENSSNRSG